MPRSASPIRAAGAALALLCLLSAPAVASDRVTVNHTDTYVDPNLSAAFVTTPNLCTEPVGTQGTSPDGCDALGDAAVLAATGSGPDVYFEPSGSQLQAKNAFVPSNPGSTVGNTGFSPIFSQHKYDLFGRSGDTMGVYTREEFLFLTAIDGITSGEGVSNGQTTPGEDTLLKFLAYLLARPQGASGFSVSGLTFQIADLPTYQRITGFTTGQATTVHDWCLANVPPLFQATLCAPGVDAETYVRVHYPQAAETSCGPGGFFDCVNRDEWVDQTVVGYVESWASLGGDGHFAQNFRTQVGYNPAAAILDSGTSVVSDFRLQQSVELSGAFTTEATDPGDTLTPGDNQDDVAGRQTFEVAMHILSGAAGIDALVVDLDQMVAQDVNGYFSSCLNCDTAANQALGYDHAFTPAKLDLTFMPYSAGWQTVPTVTHAP